MRASRTLLASVIHMETTRLKQSFYQTIVDLGNEFLVSLEEVTRNSLFLLTHVACNFIASHDEMRDTQTGAVGALDRLGISLLLTRAHSNRA
jgi:hypothetical protein